jgi:phosphate starvation-inducible PhoH-like protein
VDVTYRLPDSVDRGLVVGPAERNLKVVREALGVRVAARGDSIQLSGERSGLAAARAVLDRLADAALAGKTLSRQQVLDVVFDAAKRVREGDPIAAQAIEPVEWDGRLSVYAAGRPVAPKTANQRHYLEAIRTHDLVFALGPAGTGKTYLAVAAAVHLLRIEAVRKLVLVRPAVEAGEKLGFLPGDMREKVNPYLRPLLDALHDMMDFGTIQRFLQSDVIEISPLAFMRGRTLNGAIVILDEAQNATKSQMKMFLTRLGHGSKMIVTGDSTQTDLPDGQDNGLIDAAVRLSKTRGVAFVHLTTQDVVRHDLVQRVIEAYEDKPRKPRASRPPGPRRATAADAVQRAHTATERDSSEPESTPSSTGN